MTQQLVIGDIGTGLKLDRAPFVIDNDAFPFLKNFYTWRGRVKKKRGTVYLGRLELQVEMATDPNAWQVASFNLVLGAGNLLTNYSFPSTSTMVPDSISLVVNSKTYVDPFPPDGTLLQSGPQAVAITGITNATSAVVTIVGSTYTLGQVVYISGVNGMPLINNAYYTISAVGSNTITIDVNSTNFGTYTSGGTAYLAAQGTINYATGAITIVGGASHAVTGTFSYYPGLPVMGLEDYVSGANTFAYPLLIAFDTVNAYEFNQNNVANYFYNISYYKVTELPVVWSGADYQQFWTTNYSGAFWATNNNPGFSFMNLTDTLDGDTLSVMQTSATTATMGLTANGLAVGDFVFINEVSGTIGTGTLTTQNQNINGQTGQVTTAGTNSFVATFDATTNPGTTTANFQSGATATGGIAQYLTRTSSFLGGDGIRWYDGDPTLSGDEGGTGLPTGTGLGWVNFSPPLSLNPYSINNMPPAIYYLCGAAAITPFKDRLLFIAPWVITSSATNINQAIQLEDTILWSWNGTPFYAGPVPVHQTFEMRAYIRDITGFGGSLPAGISQAITAITNNEDVILVGFSNRQTRFVFTGNDLQPFLFFTINSELGSLSLFSSITLDRGGLSIGNHGITLTTQTGTQRIDLDIPDTIFQISNQNNGVLRVNSVRDFFNEWIYFTYTPDNSQWVYPTQTLLWNYRDNTWAIQYESYTAQGTFRRNDNYTWATIGTVFPTWNDWREPWNSATTNALFPTPVGGNAEGFVVERAVGTGEAQSKSIAAIGVDANGNTVITSYNNCLQSGDYIYIQGCLGQTYLNGQIGRIGVTIVDSDTFSINIAYQSGTYLGLGTFALLTLPQLQTKQFPMFWAQGRQVRFGFQQYLFDRTVSGQVILSIYLSQDNNTAYNSGPIVPAENSTNNSLIYNQIIFTSPEPVPQSVMMASLGLVGDGVTLSYSFNYQALFDFSTPIVSGSVFIAVGNVATFTDTAEGGFVATGTGTTSGSSINYDTGEIVLIFSVAPTLVPTTTNFQYIVYNIQSPTAGTQKQIWHRMNTSLIGDTVQLGISLSDLQMRDLEVATSEITLHAIQLNVAPGPYLS